MSTDEVEKMKRDAELHADEDKKRRELIDEKNKADSLVYQVEKMLKDAGRQDVAKRTRPRSWRRSRS